MRRLVISFSGGRTSGYMTWRILQEWRDRYDDIVVLFANTGCEHEKTLEFVKNCDEHFGFNTVWLEAVTNPEKGKGVTHKVVSYETASRNGEPFEAHVKKNGIPTVRSPKCTDRLKAGAMRAYVRDVLGHKRRDYNQCVGIRADEIDRMSEEAMAEGVIYPLVKWGITKQQVLDWWASQAFDLDLIEYLGNCVTCFKKSDRKLFTIAKDNPEAFGLFDRFEREHGKCGPWFAATGEELKFFRKHRSAQDIIASSKEPFTPWTPTTAQQQIGMFSLDEMDLPNGGCSESCEVEYI